MLDTTSYVKLLEITVPSALTDVSIDGLTAYDETNPEAAWQYVKTTVDGNTVLKLVDKYDAEFSYTVVASAPAYDTTEGATNQYTITASADFADYDAADQIYNASAEGIVSVEAPAPEHTHAAVNYTDNGDGTHDGVCDCEDATVVVDNEAHTYPDGTCICGATEVTGPTVDESLATYISLRGLNISDKFGIEAMVNFGTENKPTAYRFEVVKHAVDAKTYQYLDTPVVGDLTPYRSFDAYGLYYFNYSDISFYEMSLPLEFKLYVTDADGSIRYCTVETTFAQQALLYYQTNINDTLKASLAVDLLNLATKAQIYFGNQGTDGNALASMTTMPNEGINQDLATDYGTLVNDGAGSQEIKINGLRMLATPSLYYSANLTTTYKTPEDLTFTAYYETKLNGGATVQRTTNGSGLLETEKQYANYGLYYFTFDQVALFDTNKVVTYKIEASDGTTWTYTSSMEAYLASKIDDSTTDLNLLYKAVASFGKSAQNYWSDLA